MSQIIRRRVLIREKELKKLRIQALQCSEYGHKNLYDDCEWRPLTTKDFLIEMIKHNKPSFEKESFLDEWINDRKNLCYDPRYRKWDLRFINEVLHITSDFYRFGYKPFGWAVLTKTL